MYPVLFNFGPLPVRTHGVMVIIGFLVGAYVVWRLSKSAESNASKTVHLACWSFVVGLAGARLLYLITRASHFAHDPWAMLRFWQGGLVFFGGPLAVLPFAIWYCRKHGLPKWKTLDTLLPGLVIALAIGRLGCLCAGCCYGLPTESGFGVRFNSAPMRKELRGIPLHPTQLYEAGALLVLFPGLLWFYRHQKFDGQVFLIGSMAYAIVRTVIEVYRGDPVRGFVIDGVLSTSQFISLFVFTAAAMALAVRLRASKITRRVSEGSPATPNSPR